jgi:hypothetical protein
MTQLETELLMLSWPAACAIIAALGRYWFKSQASRLDAISENQKQIVSQIVEIRGDIDKDRANNQHRVDRLIGMVHARVSRIEGVCEVQHNVKLARRSDDKIMDNWAYESDISNAGAGKK